MTGPIKTHPLLLEFLAWVERRPRTYAETMDAWRTSCPRHSVWEDAWLGGLVAVEIAADGAKEQLVLLTPAGRSLLEETHRQATWSKEMTGAGSHLP